MGCTGVHREQRGQLSWAFCGAPSAAVGPDALVSAFSVADHSRATKPRSLSQTLPLTWAGAGGGWGLEEAGNCKSE